MLIKSPDTVVFLDSAIEDQQTLLKGLKPQTELVTLRENQDGIKVITEYLSNNPNLKTLHIVSHGSPGCVYLGNAIFGLDNIKNYTKYLAKWSVKEIFLYGCNIAAGDAGEEFLTKLHDITGSSIAASKTLTGNENQGGNWNIDVTLGQITSDLAFDEGARKAYAGVLTTYTVNTLQDENNGIDVGGVSLRDAITAANANSGADTILFNSALNNAIITLTQGQLQITDDLTIKGNSATPVGISGNNNNRVFLVQDNTSQQINVTFDGLKIINGADWGGGIYNNNENTTVKNSIISGNKGGYGAGIFNDNNGKVTVINSTISGNSASAVGGGIFSEDSTVTNVINSTIAGNTAANSGGGFYNSGSSTYTSTIINSTISGNSANYNGGIANITNLTVINSTLSGNTANIRSGGLGNSGQVSIFNSTITQNSAPQDAGGGIGSDGSSSAIITQLANTIVSGNSGRDVDNYYGSNNTFVSIGNNLIGDGDGVGNFFQPGDQTNITNPRLGALTNNGGSTLTHKPLSTSAAINGGSNISIALDSLDIDGDGNTTEQIAFDQTGESRIQGGTVDIGAVETNSGTPASLLSIGDATVTEGNSGTKNANFILTLNRSSNQQITVKYSTTNGTGVTGAVSPTDFTGATNKTLVINPGSSSATISIPVKGDTTIERNETFLVKLNEASNATINDGTGIGTITNDDFASISLGQDLTVTEGNSGQKFVNFPIKLSRASAIPVSVTVKTANGTATAGTDYNALNQVITFAANQTTATAKVVVKGDTTFELNENFSVNLSNPVSGTITKAQVKGNITNDDLKPKISIGDVTVTEGNSGTKNATFQVKLTNPSYQTISADYITVNGTAGAPSDYNAKSGQVIFYPGQTTQSLTVQIRGDKTFEGNETFSMKLSGLTNVTAGDITGVGTIRNDDAAGALVGTAESFSLGESTSDLSQNIALNDSISLGKYNATETTVIDQITPSTNLSVTDSLFNNTDPTV